MERLSKEDYREAVGCLKRYNYNCVNILTMRLDIMSIGSPSLDGMPKAPYAISDNVYNSVVKLQEMENERLNKSFREYKAVKQAYELVNNDSKLIFEELYQKNKYKWDIINDNGLSERTFVRRKGELIHG